MTGYETLSELSDDKGVNPLTDAVALLQDYLLELAIRTVPLLHELPVLAEFAD